MNRAVFLDRDNTIIVDKHYLADADGVELLPHAGAGLRRIQELGFLLVVFTNQSGVGRGYFEIAAVDAQHERLRSLLEPYGVQLDAIKVCPHAPEDRCACRKPQPAMLQEAADELNLDLAASFMIGDKPSDIEAGHAAGCRTILIGNTECTTADLLQAAELIER